MSCIRLQRQAIRNIAVSKESEEVEFSHIMLYLYAFAFRIEALAGWHGAEAVLTHMISRLH